MTTPPIEGPTETVPKRGGRLSIALQILAALALVAWRLALHPIVDLWQDWMAVLGLLWIPTAFFWRSRDWPTVTAAVALYLLVVYSLGQIPQTLINLGFSP